MRRKTIHRTAVILLDEKSSADNTFIKDWFRKSRFLTNETTDIFQVIEEITDFTVYSRPDVVLVEVDSPKRNFTIVREIMRNLSDDSEFSIFALSDSGKIVDDCECFEGNLHEVEERLEKMIPKIRRAAAGA